MYFGKRMEKVEKVEKVAEYQVTARFEEEVWEGVVRYKKTLLV